MFDIEVGSCNIDLKEVLNQHKEEF